jgi:PKD domain-containing protein/beta-propeller repeat-containing protein
MISLKKPIRINKKTINFGNLLLGMFMISLFSLFILTEQISSLNKDSNLILDKEYGCVSDKGDEINPDEYYIERLERLIDRPIASTNYVAKLSNSTLLGGSKNDGCNDIVIDNTGCAYITGYTYNGTTNFPTTPGAINTTHNGGQYDVFVCKISADGTKLLYSTFLGGSGGESGQSIAIDNTGCAYITGYTYNSTTNFPTTPGAINTTHNDNDGEKDVFVCKISADGTDLLYSTLLGGSGDDNAVSIAINNTGYAYITGTTYDSTTDFPTTPGAINTTHNGGLYDVFVCMINIDATELLYSTLLGGSGADTVSDIVIDDSGCAYITGTTYDSTTDFPSTPGAINTTHNDDGSGKNDVYVSKISADGTELLYSTFLGGSSEDVGEGIVIDNKGSVYISGYTYDSTTDFPTTPGAINKTKNENNGDSNVFVCKISADGTALQYSALFGSSYADTTYDLALDGSGCVYTIGITAIRSSDFPTTPGAINETLMDKAGGEAVFICKISADGTEMEYSTLIGGTGSDFGCCTAVNDLGSVYVAGCTPDSITDFPTTPGAINETHNDDDGETDVFVCKLNFEVNIFPNASLTVNATNIVEGQSVNFTFTGSKGNQPTNFQWNFGDSSKIFTPDSPTHQFMNKGNYTITLKITDFNGDMNLTEIKITVSELSTNGTCETCETCGTNGTVGNTGGGVEGLNLPIIIGLGTALGILTLSQIYSILLLKKKKKN